MGGWVGGWGELCPVIFWIMGVIVKSLRRVSCYRCFSRVQPAVVCTTTTTTSPLPGTPATSPT